MGLVAPENNLLHGSRSQKWRKKIKNPDGGRSDKQFGIIIRKYVWMFLKVITSVNATNSQFRQMSIYFSHERKKKVAWIVFKLAAIASR